jgi:hypothetical protein
MATGEQLIRALAPDDTTVVQAWHTSAEFHAMIELFARVAPSILHTLAAEALETEVGMRRLIDLIAEGGGYHGVQ